MASEQTALDVDRIRSLLAYAVLAPSSHNTQPWRFEVADGKVFLYADRTRALPVNDPDDRELTISCGCALMNLRVAAAHAGLGVTLDCPTDLAEADLLAVVSFTGSGASSPNEAGLFESIPKRRTYRKPFRAEAVPAPTLDALRAAASAEGAWLEVVAPEETRQRIAALVAEGDAMQWSDPGWRRELAAWMHPRRRGDGLTVPGILAPIARVAVRAFDMGKGIGAKDRQLAEASPVLAVLGTAGDDVGDWLTAGQALERLLLSARSAGLQASYLNQPIQVASLRPRLQALMRQPGFPQLVLRLGFPEEDLDATPRRGLEHVADHRTDGAQSGP
jgi:hypothetical protein